MNPAMQQLAGSRPIYLPKAAHNSASGTAIVSAAPATNSGAPRKYGVAINDNSAIGNVAAQMLTVRTIIRAHDAPCTECGAA